MKFILRLIWLCLILTANNSYAQSSKIRISESYGPFSVGFKVHNTNDRSRSFYTETGDSKSNANHTSFRPMQVCIWYPAPNSGSAPMIYEDYFFLKAHETGEVVITEKLKEKLIKEFLETDPVDPKILGEELKAQMMAVLNAPEFDKLKFPVVIYGPSWWSTAFENALLCEFLASHGYVVVSSPSMGPVTREMPISRIGVETQARDMEFLLARITEFNSADIENLAVSGFSLGGLSNVLMYARNTSVDAWIGLDPSIHEAYGFFKDSPYEDYGRFTKPTLFINSVGYMNDLPFYDRLVYSDAFIVNLPKLEHTDLASQFIKLYAPRDLEGLELRLKGYDLMAKYCLLFLNGVFKEKYNYDDFLREGFHTANLDTSFVKIKSKKGLPSVDKLFQMFSDNGGNGLIKFLQNTIDGANGIRYPEQDVQKLIYISSENSFNFLSAQLMEWYGRNYPNSFYSRVLQFRDSAQMLEMFLEVYKKNKSCQFGYDELNHTAHVLSMSGEGIKSINYFELNSLLHPKDARAFFNLGLGYYRIEDFANAKINFNKCLEFEPDERYRNLALDYRAKLK
ncbi:MAG: hypothetical protein JSV59_09205 [Flavobacteriaceae bacterium]|nr:MAG: hypothetical protein JSV59_09205 [Flavobacteriaceae bacterium]